MLDQARAVLSSRPRTEPQDWDTGLGHMEREQDMQQRHLVIGLTDAIDQVRDSSANHKE